MMESDPAPETAFSAAEPKAGNVPHYTVSEISGAIKRTLESGFGRVRVRGEITELKRYSSGHVYLSLKDEGGKIAGVVWRGCVPRLGLNPENGMEVVATGRVSAYGERSSYQLIIDRMEFAGEGALLARIEFLRKKLLAEGLFAAERKKPIPFLPVRVGVVTSRSGAVLHDICTTISRRFPREIVLWPVAVQGEGAVPQLVAAIEGMASRVHPRPDVLIVARGGGSLEDLMAFNDENVVRAVAACPIPVISAVGHETDTTLIDFASDRRAPTPTAAAEMAVPLRSELLADLAHRTARLLGGWSRIRQGAAARLGQLAARLPDLPMLLDTARMRLDDRAQRLDLALPSCVMRARAQLGAPSRHLPRFDLIIAQRQVRIRQAASALETEWRRLVQSCALHLGRQRLTPDTLYGTLRLQRARLDGAGAHLEAVSPLAVLKRGYVLVQDSSGQPMVSAGDHPGRESVRLSFADGRRDAVLTPLAARPVSEPAPPDERSRRCSRSSQGDLGL